MMPLLLAVVAAVLIEIITISVCLALDHRDERRHTDDEATS